MRDKSFKTLIDNASKTDAYWAERAIIEFTTDLNRLMKSRQINQAQFARKLNKSSAYITKVFRGQENFTIETMTKLTRTLNGRLHIHIADENSTVRWFDVFNNKRPAKRTWINKNFHEVLSDKHLAEIS
ncbi:MAG: helix-turn-helix transcriptional regulator [Methylococcaceae bacterium]